jgi:LemA protein
MEILIMVLCAILGLAGIILLVGIFLYNGLVRAKTRVDETWKQIDVRLQNRYDLLPDLIQAVEKATTTDKEIQTKIAEVRSAASNAQAVTSDPVHAAEAAQAQGLLTGALNGLRVAVEAYPELRSQEAIQNFMNQNVMIEEKIAASRQIYNSTAREYNEKIAVVPSNIVAGMFKFTAVSYFEARDEARNDVGADWGGNVVSR